MRSDFSLNTIVELVVIGFEEKSVVPTRLLVVYCIKVILFALNIIHPSNGK